jgi:hypothetical protein
MQKSILDPNDQKRMEILEEFIKDCKVFHSLLYHGHNKNRTTDELCIMKNNFLEIIMRFRDLENGRRWIDCEIERFANGKYQFKLIYEGEYMASYFHLIPSDFHYKVIRGVRQNVHTFTDYTVNQMHNKYYREQQFLEKLKEHPLNADLLKIVYSYLVICYL